MCCFRAMCCFGSNSGGHARDGAAFLTGLRRWRQAGEVVIDAGPEGTIDARCAHKPGISSRGGRLYHFYRAAAPTGERPAGDITREAIRGIALATS